MLNNWNKTIKQTKGIKKKKKERKKTKWMKIQVEINELEHRKKNK